MTKPCERTKVLITVMTYPHPSRGHNELICTAGLTESGDWVRLYSIDYRYRPKEQQFKKYQWIEVDLDAKGAGNDDRKESRRPILDTLRLIGKPLSAEKGWEARREIIDKIPNYTLHDLKRQFDLDRTSLGIVKPQRILDLEIRTASSNWKPEWKLLFDQMTLFGPQQKPLSKIPFSFHYIFECEDDTKPHTAMCEDWELGVLFLNEVARLGSEKAAADSVKQKFFNEICAPDRDTSFYMGTFFPYNVWLVLGLYWPPKIAQPKLF